MAADGFRDLAVYGQAVTLAVELERSVREWDSFARWTVGVQLVRAADSVGANIAEACGRLSKADRLRMLYIARGSTLEVQHWLLRAGASELPYPPTSLSEAERIGRMLNGLARSWRARPEHSPNPQPPTTNHS